MLNASFTNAFTPNSGNNNDNSVTSLNELESNSRFVDKETQTIDPELCFLDKETQTKDPYSCCHPELSEKSSILTFFERSANAYIEPKKDNYFDSDTIIKQFERLFKLVKFKKIFHNHNIEILVDNARTHSANEYDVNLISKSPNTNFPYETIEWNEDRITKSVE